MRVLHIEDDETQAAAVENMLRAQGFVVDATDLGEDGLDIAKRGDYELVLLDIDLPDMNGFEVLRHMRQAKVHTPVVILSGQDQIEGKVRGLNAGADDYITKPFAAEDLIARLNAVVRRSHGLASSSIQVGGLTIDTLAKSVYVDGKRLHLTVKEYAILELLAMRRGRMQTKSDFLNHLYGGMDEPEVKIVDVFICKVRKKLQAAGVRDCIETVWGKGYVIWPDDAQPVAVVA